MRIFTGIALYLLTSLAIAADLNGYEAKYECRSGNTNCNVDVASLGQRMCDQIIATGTPWSSINWSNNTICIEAGNHTGKGTLIIPNTPGSASNYKVLRYYRTSDNNDDPWNQGGNQAIISALQISASDFWLIHRLTFSTRSDNVTSILFENDVTNTIISRVLIEGSNGTVDVCRHGTNTVGGGSDRITIQNSVVRNLLRCTTGSPVGVSFESGTNNRIVNNEIYNWSEHEVQIGNNSEPLMPGTIVENNDIYKNSAIYNVSGDSCGGWLISLKAYSTVGSSPVQVLHNRLYGVRPQASSCGTPDSGHAIGANAGNGLNHEFNLIQDNIFIDNFQGVGYFNFILRRESIVGNIFYDTGPRGSLSYSHVVSLYSASDIEIYLNTIVLARRGTGDGVLGEWSTGHTGFDIRCNVFLDSDQSSSIVPASSSIMDYNVFYATPVISFNGTGTNLSRSFVDRSNSTFYAANTILRVGAISSCSSNEEACYIYKVTVAGTSASIKPAYPISLGGIVNDGTMQAIAIRGPYSFYRKLRTAPAQFSIPYATVHSQAPEIGMCPTIGEANAVGSRVGIGVNDDIVPNGIFQFDLSGRAR